MLTPEKVKRLKRMNQKQKDLDLLRLSRECDKIWEEIRKTPWVELETPIPNGFKKYFVLRDDIARRRDVDVFTRILKTINQTVYSKEQDFKIRRKFYKQGHRGKTHRKYKIEDIPHHLRIIPKQEWERLNWPAMLTKHFYRGVQIVTDRYGIVQTYEGYIFKYPYYFVSKVEKNFITHIRPINPDLESRKKRLYNKIDRLNAWPRITHLLFGSYNDHWDDYEVPRSQKEMKEWERAEYEYYNEITFNNHLMDKYMKEVFGQVEVPWNDPLYVFD